MTAPRVLFVCLGNICRSPLAEAAFRAAADAAFIEAVADSAGTANYHVGQPPDERAIAEAARHGIDITGFRGRQLQVRDFHEFDYIFGMDRQNMRDIARIDPGNGTARVALLLDMLKGQEGCEVADPWYGEQDAFRKTWTEVDRAADALVDRLR